MANQEILLIEDVDHVGRSGDIVKVKPGYARNFLFPRGYAVVADKATKRRQAKLQEERRIRAESDRKEAEVLAAQLKNVTLKTTVKVDPEGHPYGSINAMDLLHMLTEQAQITLEKRNVLLKQAIKKLGTHTVELKLKEGVEAAVALVIEGEGVSATAVIAETEAAEETAGE